MLPRIRLCLCILVVYFLAIGLVHGQDASNAKEQSADNKKAAQLEEPKEEPESVTAGTGVGHATPQNPHPPIHHKMNGAPHAIDSWKTPIDYLIDPKPKVAEHNGGNIIDPTTEDQLPSSNKAMLNMFQGVRVLLDRPVHVLSELDLRKIGEAVNEAAAKSNFVLDKRTSCFCRVVAPKTRCTCTNGETRTLKQTVKPHITHQNTKEKTKVLFDAEATRARHEEIEKQRLRHEEHVKYVYDREGNRHQYIKKRLQQHKDAVEIKSSQNRGCQISGETAIE